MEIHNGPCSQGTKLDITINLDHGFDPKMRPKAFYCSTKDSDSVNVLTTSHPSLLHTGVAKLEWTWTNMPQDALDKLCLEFERDFWFEGSQDRLESAGYGVDAGVDPGVDASDEYSIVIRAGRVKEEDMRT